MRLEDFNYDLPVKLIAQQPLKSRDMSRLLVLERKTGSISHRIFHELLAHLESGDVLVMNDTRVLPARLIGRRVSTGGKVELLLLEEIAPGRWGVLVKPGRRCLPGDKVKFGQGQLVAEILERTPEGGRQVAFNLQGEKFMAIIGDIGQVPLPPYIHTNLTEPERYQTVYARHLGSAAAPTAGLHFTPELLSEARSLGVGIVFVTLSVGLGTFRPVQEEIIEQHRMHSEKYYISAEAAQTINAAKAEGCRVIAVGTTVVRTLEAAGRSGQIEPGARSTDLFIYPGFEFKIVDSLITNFHLPKSSLLMLVAAFAGYDNVRTAYEEAIFRRYRFFSFGDAMLIV